MVQAIPDNYPRVSAAPAVDGAAEAIDFYAAVFGARERMRFPAPDSRAAAAQLKPLIRPVGRAGISSEYRGGPGVGRLARLCVRRCAAGLIRTPGPPGRRSTTWLPAAG